MDVSKLKKELNNILKIDDIESVNLTMKEDKLVSEIEDSGYEFDAIISIDENGNGHLLIMQTNEHWKLDSHSMYDPLPEINFKVKPGLYYANMIGEMCGGDRCRGYPCAGDCFETDWELKDCIFEIDENINREKGCDNGTTGADC